MKNDLIRLASVDVSSKRTIVVSHNPEQGKIIIGQQIHTFDEDNRPLSFFLKGALNISEDMLPKVREAIEEAIKVLEL